MKILLKAFFILLGVILALLLSAGFILSYKSKEILQEIVSKASKDQYRLEAKKVSIFYNPAGIVAEKVILIPVSTAPRQARLSFEKLEIRLNSVINLLFRKNLEILKIEVNKPEVTAYSKAKSGTLKHGISETIHEIQSTLLKSIQVLHVQDVRINDASLKIYSADTSSNRFLGINHIFLHLNEIYLDKEVNQKGEGLNMKGSLTLKNPDVNLVDSNISVSVNHFKANVTDRSLEIDSFELKIRGKESGPQHLKLSRLNILHLNWDRFLKEGVIEIDSLMAQNGIANINLASKNQLAHPSEKKKGYTGGTFIIHHTFISDIAYQVYKERKVNQNANNISLDVKGDSMYLQDFSLVHDRQPAFDVKNLDITFRNFKESDENRNASITLGAMTIDSSSIVLKNYLLETNKADTQKNYFRIAVPEFRLNKYSLEEVLAKKLAASSISLINPNIIIDIRQVNSEGKQKKDIDKVFGNLMQKVSGKARLEEIAIENGSISIFPTLSPEDQIHIDGLSVVLDAGMFPEIKTAHDFIAAIKRFDSKGFKLKGPKMQLEIQDMSLLTSPRGIYFGSVKGQFGEGRMIDFEGVTILLNEQMDYLHTHDILATLVNIEKGMVTIEMPDKKKEKPVSNGKQPSIRADKVILNNIAFKIKKGTGVGISAELDIEGEDLNFDKGQLSWNKLSLASLSSDAFFGKTVFNTGELKFEQPGIISILHANGKSETPNAKISFSADQLELSLGLESTRTPSLTIDGIKLVNPALKVALHKQTLVQPASKPGKSLSRDITLKSLILQEPTIDLTIFDSAGNRKDQHRAYTGTFLLKDIHTLNEPELKIGNLSYSTYQPKSEFRGLVLNPGALHISVSDISYNTLNKHFKFHVDSLVVEKIAHTNLGKKNDTITLLADAIGVRNFNYEKGQKINAETFLNTGSWWAKNADITYHTPKQLIMGKGISAKSANSISLTLDSFYVLNRLSREEVWNANPYEKGYETLTGGKLQLSGISISLAGKKPAVSISKFNSYNLHFTTAKDKTKLEDTIDYRPLLTQMFTKIPLPLQIDSVLLEGARVDANEISKKTGEETQIYFTDINGYIKNIKTWDIKENDTLDMRVRARFYGTDQLRLHFKQSYYDSLQGFWMRVRMSHFNMPEMNKLLTPLMGLKINSGSIDSLLLVANGNDHFAYGTMDLRFHNLHAGVVKTEDSKGKFLISIENFFAGLLLRKHDNGRTNLLFKERLRKRSIFNFWAKIGLEGLLTNLGIKRDKKERKQFEKNVEKFKLPEKYWDEIDDLNP